jgi:integrase
MTARTPEDIVEMYIPHLPAEIWDAIGPFVRDAVRRGFEPTAVPKVAGVRIAMTASLVAWAVEQGLPLDVEQVFHPATVNRYAITIPGLSDATRSSRRATLTTLSRRITHTAPWEPPRELLPDQWLLTLYTDAQTRWLVECASQQPTPSRQHRLAAALALGLGAGLRATEMIRVTASDVRVRRSRVFVRVGGPPVREVPVLERYAPSVVEAARRAGGGHLFRDPVPRVEYVSHLVNSCDIPKRLRPLTAARLRVTWEVTALQAVPLPVFMTLAGLTSVASLRQVFALVSNNTSRRSWTAAELESITKAVPP